MADSELDTAGRDEPAVGQPGSPEIDVRPPRIVAMTPDEEREARAALAALVRSFLARSSRLTSPPD